MWLRFFSVSFVLAHAFAQFPYFEICVHCQLVCARKIGLPELRRLRQQFLHMSKITPPQGGAAQVASMFVQYLRQSIE